MFTIIRHFSKIVQPITINTAYNQCVDKYYILKHNLNIINKNINENNISNDDIKINYDNNDVNKSSGVLYFKYIFIENGVKYNGTLYSRFITSRKSSNNISEEEEHEHEHMLALKHAWSN